MTNDNTESRNDLSGGLSEEKEAAEAVNKPKRGRKPGSRNKDGNEKPVKAAREAVEMFKNEQELFLNTASPRIELSPCYRAALKLLSYNDRTEKQMRTRLTDKGFTAEEVAKTVDLLCKKRFISDKRMMENEIFRLARHRYLGRVRIKPQLAEKFDFKSIFDYYESIIEENADELDFQKYAIKYAMNYADRPVAYIRMKLRTNGYTWTEINNAVEYVSNIPPEDIAVKNGRSRERSGRNTSESDNGD